LTADNQYWSFELQDNAGSKPIGITLPIEDRWYYVCQSVTQESSPGAFNGKHKATILLDDGQVKVYYGAADTAICVSTAHIDDIVAACFRG